MWPERVDLRLALPYRIVTQDRSPQYPPPDPKMRMPVNLRYIHLDGAEVLRAISCIVRAKDWGTYSPVITDLQIKETDDRFLITVSATACHAAQSFSYSARIEGTKDGTLVFTGRGSSQSGFLTNRTGFVVCPAVTGIDTLKAVKVSKTPDIG